MKVLIINTNRNKKPMPVMPLGACMVAEATGRAGHAVQFLDLMFSKSPVQKIQQALAHGRPDVVALSVRNIDNNDMRYPEFYPIELLPILETIKQWRDVPIVLGGAAVSVMPEELLRFTNATCAVIGDGEIVFPALLEHLGAANDFTDVPGVCWIDDDTFFRNPAPKDAGANHCSVPDLSYWLDVKSYQRRLATAPVQTKLGCHFQCIYCTYRKIEGNKYRVKEPQSVAESVCKLGAMGFGNVEFVDNVFNSPYDHAMEICSALCQSGNSVRLHTLELNPLNIDDKLMTAMELAGFVGTGITVESASSAVLSQLKKGYSAAEVYKAAETVRRHAIPCLWIFMLGGPGETGKTVLETLRFAETMLRPRDTAFFTTGIRIYPGTELEKIAREQGVLTLPVDQMLEPVFYLSPNISHEWLLHTVKKAMRKNMHFINGKIINLSYLPLINRLGAKLGINPPLWRYARYIRRGLRFVGVDA